MAASQVVILLALGALGAGVGRVLRLPMWPLTGSILGGLLAHALGLGHVSMPAWLPLAGQLLVGCAVGSAVGRELFATVLRVTGPGAVVVASLVGTGLLVGMLIMAADLASPAVALLGSIPAGVGEMVAVAAGMGTDSALVAAMHLVRLCAVLLTLPLLLRWARGWRRSS